MVNNELSLDKDWKIGEDSFRQIVNEIKAVQPNLILEFGAGTSSIRLAKEFENSNVISIDHNLKFYKEAKKLSESYALSNLSILLNPLRWQMHGLAFFKSYKLVEMNQNVDVVIIDGPPSSNFRGREACLYQVYNKIPVGGVIILDDYNRANEREYVKNWLARYPGCFSHKELKVGHTLCVLKKIDNSRMRANVHAILDNYILLAKRILRRIGVLSRESR